MAIESKENERLGANFCRLKISGFSIVIFKSKKSKVNMKKLNTFNAFNLAVPRSNFLDLKNHCEISTRFRGF